MLRKRSQARWPTLRRGHAPGGDPFSYPFALPGRIILDPANPHWWMDQPIRLAQTNLRETDFTLDTQRLAQQVAESHASALLFKIVSMALKT